MEWERRNVSGVAGEEKGPKEDGVSGVGRE